MLLTVETLVLIGVVVDVLVVAKAAKVPVTQRVLIHVADVLVVPDIAVPLVASVRLGVAVVKMLVEDVNRVKVELWEAVNVSHQAPVPVVQIVVGKVVKVHVVSNVLVFVAPSVAVVVMVIVTGYVVHAVVAPVLVMVPAKVIVLAVVLVPPMQENNKKVFSCRRQENTWIVD